MRCRSRSSESNRRSDRPRWATTPQPGRSADTPDLRTIHGNDSHKEDSHEQTHFRACGGSVIGVAGPASCQRTVPVEHTLANPIRWTKPGGPPGEPHPADYGEPSSGPAGSPHPSASQSGQPHGSQSQLAYHGSNVPLPTDAGFGQSSAGKPATGYAAAEHKQPTVSGAGGAAAGHAAAEQKQPQVSGARGAAAGAAAANRNSPQYSGAQRRSRWACRGRAETAPVLGAAAQPLELPLQTATLLSTLAHRAQPLGMPRPSTKQPQVSGAGGAAAGYAAAAHRTTAVPDSVAAAGGRR